MISALWIKQFLTIESLELDFAEGLSVITGETGAGKSLLIGAIQMVLGAKTNSSLVRKGAKQAELTALFSVKEADTIAWLNEHDLWDEETSEIVIRRVIPADGRSRVYVNGSVITLPELNFLAKYLVNIHSQHAHQALLAPAMQRKIFDVFAGNTQLAEKLEQSFQIWQVQRNQLTDLQIQQQNRSERTELLRYQVNELDELDLQAGEWVQLDQEHKQLSNQEVLQQVKQESLARLTQSDDVTIQSGIENIIQRLAEYAELDKSLADAVELLSQASIEINEAVDCLRSSTSAVADSDERLRELELKIQTILDLARKHKVAPEHLADSHQALAEELKDIDSLAPRIEIQTEKVNTLKRAYLKLAQTLTTARQHALEPFVQTLIPYLQNLGMEHAQCQVVLTPIAEENLGAHGAELISFWVKTNPEQDFHLLTDVVSGGELSRISLAIEAISAKQFSTPTFIFDEVDVGVGGKTAKTIGQLLKKISEEKQVLCITHLPQVAVFGQQHYHVDKQVIDNITFSSIIQLDEAQRTEEIARMLGRGGEDKEDLSFAKKMLAEVV